MKHTLQLLAARFSSKLLHVHGGRTLPGVLDFQAMSCF